MVARRPSRSQHLIQVMPGRVSLVNLAIVPGRAAVTLHSPRGLWLYVYWKSAVSDGDSTWFYLFEELSMRLTEMVSCAG